MLRGVLRRFEPLPVGWAVNLIGQVCEALAEGNVPDLLFFVSEYAIGGSLEEERAGA